MKKWNVIFILLFVIWGYLEFFADSTSVYWLAGKLILFALLLFGPLLRDILKKEKTIANIIYSVCFGIFFFCFFGYHGISKYKSDRCDDQFGREFNERRRSLGIPEIPADWHVDYNGRGSVSWKAKDTIGHYWKHIFVDSPCTAELENDEYKLKPLNGVYRAMSITTHYAKGKGSDSIFYYYEVGYNNRTITRHQADSIFAAEKIKKDY